MRATFLWFVGVVWLCTASAAAQRDAGVPDSGDEPAEETPEPGDTTAHQARCIQACVSAILAENMSSISQCFNEVPECQGIGDFLPDVLTGMCRAWHDIADECDEYAASVGPGGTGGTPRAPRGTVLAAGSEPGSDEDRPRPTLDLRCFASDGTEVASVGRGWNARCPVCPTGERLFEESRYVEGRPRAPRGVTRVVAVCSATRSSAAPVIASSMESLEPRVTRLESAVGGAPTREHCEGLGNVYREVMIGGNVVPVCFTPADLYLLEASEENREDVERVELNNAERDGALSRRMDALGAGRGSAGPGSIGFRFHLWGSFGFVQLSVEDGSIIPISVGGEFDPMIALGAGWYLEGGVSLGYAIPNGTFPEALQGIYRLGFLALVGLAPEHNISIGFGGFLSERYPEVPRNGFVSDHTLIGPYGELMYVARFGDGWSFNIGVRVLVGAGFRFDGQSDRTVFDGAIMPMLGIAYWGDHARYDHSRTMCTGPHCRDTAIGRVQVVGADDEETETEERAEETRPDPPSDGPMGRVSIVSRGDWSAIFIDDRPARVCTTPCEVDMPAGVHTLGIRRHGDGELVSYPITVIEGPNNNVIIRWRDEDDREPIVIGADADEDEEVDDEEILDEDESDI